MLCVGFQERIFYAKKEKAQECSPSGSRKMKPKRTGLLGSRAGDELVPTVHHPQQSWFRLYPGWLRQASGLQTVGLADSVSIQWLLIKGHTSSLENSLIGFPGPDSSGWSQETSVIRAPVAPASTQTSTDTCGNDCAHGREPLRPSSWGPNLMTSFNPNYLLRNPISKSSHTLG